MDSEVFTIISLTARYFFIALILYIVWSTIRITVRDSHNARYIRNWSISTGCVGRFKVHCKAMMPASDKKSSLPLELPVHKQGIFGSSRSADIRISGFGIQKKHFSFEYFTDGIMIWPCSHTIMAIEGQESGSPLFLHNGSTLDLGQIELTLELFSFTPTAASSSVQQEASSDTSATQVDAEQASPESPELSVDGDFSDEEIYTQYQETDADTTSASVSASASASSSFAQRQDSIGQSNTPSEEEYPPYSSFTLSSHIPSVFDEKPASDYPYYDSYPYSDSPTFMVGSSYDSVPSDQNGDFSDEEGMYYNEYYPYDEPAFEEDDNTDVDTYADPAKQDFKHGPYMEPESDQNSASAPAIDYNERSRMRSPSGNRHIQSFKPGETQRTSASRNVQSSVSRTSSSSTAGGYPNHRQNRTEQNSSPDYRNTAGQQDGRIPPQRRTNAGNPQRRRSTENPNDSDFNGNNNDFT